MQIIFNGAELEKAHAAADALPITGLTGTGLEAGSTFEAAVIFVSGSKVNIKLENGAVIRASLDGAVSLVEGDKVRFFVSENDGQHIVLIPEEILKGITGINPEQALAETSVSVIKENPKVVQAMKNCGYPPDPELCRRAVAVLANYPQTGAETAVFIAENNIPATQGNLQIADSLFRSEYEIGRAIEAVFEKLFNLKGKFTDVKFSSLAEGLAANILSADNGRRLYGRPFRPENKAERAGAESMPGKSNGTVQEEPGLTGNKAEKISGGESRDTSGLIGNEADEQDRGTSRIVERDGKYADRAGTNGETVGAERRAPYGEETYRGENRVLLPPNGERADSGPLSTTDEALRQVFRILSEGDGNGGIQPFAPEKVQSFIDVFFAQIDKDCTGGKLREATMVLPERLEMLGRYLASRAVSGGEETASEIKSLLDATGLFRRTLPFAYMQIPIRMNMGRGTAQLYVSRRKREAGTGMRRDLCVILVLNTAGMGHVEVYMRINSGGISIKFTAKRDEISDFIREHTVELYRMMSRAGYRMSDIRFTVSGKRTTPIVAPTVFLQTDLGERQKINIRV